MGFLTTFSILINKKFRSSGFINRYLIVAFTISSTRFFLYGIQTYLTNTTLRFMVLNLGEIAYVIIVPLLFLYFQNLLYETKWNRKMLLHLVVPIIISILNYARFFFIDEQIVRQLKMAIFVVYIPFTLMYVFLTLRIFNIQMKGKAILMR